MESVGSDFPNQQRRVRELIKIYEQLGPVGTFGKIMLEDALRRADEAAISGDIVAIVQSYQEMKGCK